MKIGVGRYATMLRSLLHATSEAAPAELEDVIQSGLTLESDRPEWAFLLGESRFMGRVTKAADVANISYVGLFNGQATGAIGMLERIYIVNNTAAALVYIVIIGGLTGLTGTFRGQVLDLRWRTKASALLLGSGVEAAQTGRVVGSFRVAGGSSLLLDARNFILPPNEQGMTPVPNVTVTSDSINSAIDATFEWRERTMDRFEGPERR